MDPIPSEVLDFATRHDIKINTPERIAKVVRLLETSNDLLRVWKKISEAESEATRLRRELVQLRIELERMP